MVVVSETEERLPGGDPVTIYISLRTREDKQTERGVIKGTACVELTFVLFPSRTMLFFSVTYQLTVCLFFFPKHGKDKIDGS